MADEKNRPSFASDAKRAADVAAANAVPDQVAARLQRDDAAAAGKRERDEAYRAQNPVVDPLSPPPRSLADDDGEGDG